MSTQNEKIIAYSESQEVLQKANIQTITILERITDAFIALDTEWRYVYVNPQAKKMFQGKTLAELFGKRPEEVFPQVVGSTFEKMCREALQSQEKVSFETFSKAFGRWYEIHVYPSKEGLTIYFHDITRRKQLEEERQRYAAELEAVIDCMPDGVFIGNSTGVTKVNKHAATMLGFDNPEELLRGIMDLRDTLDVQYHGRKLPAEEGPFMLALEGKSGIYEALFRHLKTKNVHVLRNATSTIWNKDGQRIGAIAVATDVTEQKRAENAWKELEQRKNEFISIASHELKTPITTLQGLTELLKRRFEKQGMAEPVTFLSKMERQIKNLTRLINELLDVSKIEAGKLDYAEEQVDIDALVHDTAETLQQISSTHEIVVHGTSNKHIVGDRNRLEQVFTNLIINAIKYSPDADIIDIDIATPQDTLTVNIRDYGVGIPKEHQSNIFDRFYRVHATANRAFPGLGMGLYISSEIIKRHGGEITVESEEGKGSTFSVSLPLITSS